MRDLALAWPDPADVAAAAATLPWGHVQVLLDRLPDTPTRAWYAERAIAGGWSRAVLQDPIAGLFMSGWELGTPWLTDWTP